jgi:hypothetical protein
VVKSCIASLLERFLLENVRLHAGPVNRNEKMDPKIFLLMVLMCAIVASSHLASRTRSANEKRVRARSPSGTIASS